jgi:hypothetical protein
MKRFLTTLSFTLLSLCILSTSAFTAVKGDFKPAADEMIGPAGITWMPKVNYSRLVLTVSRPDGTVLSKTFEPGITPFMDLSVISSDGMYTYELQVVPVVPRRTRKSIETAGLENDIQLQEPLIQTGYFTVRDGMIITSNSPERIVNPSQDNISRTMDEVIYDDLIVDGSLCVGNDCYSGLAFGFDTIVLMENNLRIYFDDTSNTSSFPRNDWRIVINDTTDGGGAYFALQDVTGGLTPFTIEAGAKTNSLYIDDDGQVGIGTSGPVFELHIKEGDTPSVRLHQSTAYGWPEQIWDVGGNETSFFIRDGTHAARLPFRIEPETPTSTLCLKSDGKVGIGTWSPSELVEIEETGANVKLRLDRTDGAKAVFTAASTQTHIGSVSNHEFRLYVNNDWVMRLKTDETLEMSDGGGYDGTWNEASSREIKENISNLTTNDAINALAGLNPVKFNYKRHIEEERLGFIAEDVPDLVATNGRKNLSTMDIVAVLTKVLQEQQNLIRVQQKISKEQQKTIDELNKRIEKLEKK